MLRFLKTWFSTPGKEDDSQQTPINVYPESKAPSVNATSVPTCCWIQTSFPPSFTLSVSPDPFRGKVLSFPWGLHGQQETGSYYVHLTGRTAAFSVRVQLSVVTASGLQVVAQSIKCRLQLAWSQQPGGNSARCLKVTPAWRWEGRKWAFWTWFTPMRSNPGNRLASKLLLLN